ncbi:tyrosine-protein phosphatase [Ottowia sp.]|uniref:tyrosine-protein phosphatase n=1 Tax=Ottowia sp. TaxID=1898956 RepID=UPI003A8C7145
MPQRPHRSLHLEGASNFRDLGGYRGADGRVVRWRRLFRSDHLAGLTVADTQAVQGLGVTRTFDFRGQAERAAVAYDLPGAQQVPLPIEPTVMYRLKDLLESGQTVTPAMTVELMQHTYRAFVTDNAARFATLFEHLLDKDEPLVFHCTAGKDRTGFAAALILLALGVERSVVMQDYLLTNELYRMPTLEGGRTSPEVLHVLWRVQADFLDAALDAVERGHGGVDQYLAQALGVGAAERRQLQAVYLESPDTDI